MSIYETGRRRKNRPPPATILARARGPCILEPRSPHPDSRGVDADRLEGRNRRRGPRFGPCFRRRMRRRCADQTRARRRHRPIRGAQGAAGRVARRGGSGDCRLAGARRRRGRRLHRVGGARRCPRPRRCGERRSVRGGDARGPEVRLHRRAASPRRRRHTRRNSRGDREAHTGHTAGRCRCVFLRRSRVAARQLAGRRQAESSRSNDRPGGRERGAIRRSEHGARGAVRPADRQGRVADTDLRQLPQRLDHARRDGADEEALGAGRSARRARCRSPRPPRDPWRAVHRRRRRLRSGRGNARPVRPKKSRCFHECAVAGDATLAGHRFSRRHLCLGPGRSPARRPRPAPGVSQRGARARPAALRPSVRTRGG